MLHLKSEHLYINHQLVEQVFSNVEYVYAAYNTEQKQLLITPITSQWFVKMNKKPSQFLLKSRNLIGDKTVAIREILIDNDLPIQDRDLDYELIEKTELLKIKL